MADLGDFAINFCRLSGGIVEAPAFGMYEVLLPESVAARLGVDAFQRFTFDEEQAQEAGDTITHLSYGHPLIEEMVEAVMAAPANARFYINQVRLEKQGLLELAGQALSLANARLSPIPRQTVTQMLHHYVRFTFKAALLTDEKQERLVSVLMDLQNGYAVSQLADLEHQAILESENAFKDLPVASLRWLPSETDPLSRRALEALLERAVRAVDDELSEPIERLTRRAARFLELDQARLTQYYDDIEWDLAQRYERAGDEGRRASLEDKLAVTQAERQAKLLDVEAKYRLRIELELLNLLVVGLPKLTLPVEIKHRTASVTRALVWNPLLHQIEPLACDVCGRPAERLTLCSGGHLVHTDGDCLLAVERQCIDCKRLFCRLCADQVEACVVCGRPVCRHSLNRCPDCGRDTCREHVGLCHADEGAPVKLPPPEPSRAPSAPVEKPSPPPKAVGRPTDSKKAKPPSPTKKPQARATRRRTSPPRKKAARIEVYVEADKPVVVAYALSSSGKEIATRVWERVAEGIQVSCYCEKGWGCPVDQTLLEPAPPDEIDRQLWGQIGALRQEYSVSPKKVSVHAVVRGIPRPVGRLVLRGEWKS